MTQRNSERDGGGGRERRSPDPVTALLHPSDVECGTSSLCLLAGFPVSTENVQVKGLADCKIAL